MNRFDESQAESQARVPHRMPRDSSGLGPGLGRRKRGTGGVGGSSPNLGFSKGLGLWDRITSSFTKNKSLPPFRTDGTMRSGTHIFHFRRIFHGG